MATPLDTVHRVGDRRREHEAIGALAAEHEVVVLVVGLPLGLDGADTDATRAVRSEVKGMRRRLAIDVVLHDDERMSTVSAAADLRSAGVSGPHQRRVIDQTAAAVILQSWIDAGRR